MAEVAEATMEHLDEMLKKSKTGEVDMKEIWRGERS